MLLVWISLVSKIDRTFSFQVLETFVWREKEAKKKFRFHEYNFSTKKYLKNRSLRLNLFLFSFRSHQMFHQHIFFCFSVLEPKNIQFHWILCRKDSHSNEKWRLCVCQIEATFERRRKNTKKNSPFWKLTIKKGFPIIVY